MFIGFHKRKYWRASINIVRYWMMSKKMMSGDLEATQQESEWTSVFSIRAGAFQSFAMFFFGQFLHVGDGIALIDNFLAQ